MEKKEGRIEAKYQDRQTDRQKEMKNEGRECKGRNQQDNSSSSINSKPLEQSNSMQHRIVHGNSVQKSVQKSSRLSSANR